MGTQKDIVAVAALRTPIGSFGGTLRDVPAYDLGAAAIRAALERSGLEPAAIDKVIYAKKDGTVTAGNACTMGDAACALILTTREKAHAWGLPPVFSVVSFAETAVDPATMGDGPAASIPLALAAAGMTLADIDFIEVNEAFAAQILANERALRWKRERLNVWGGAIALGHPTGFTGARLLVTLSSILRRNSKELGVAAICGGGGVTAAMVIRRES